MKYTSLNELITIAPKEITLGTNKLSNLTCHHLFKTRSSQGTFYDDLKVQPDQLIIIPCGPVISSKEWTTLEQQYTFGDLLKTLHRILVGKVLMNSIVHTLIIDNLSMFYWDLKVLDDFNFTAVGGTTMYVNASTLYQRLADIIVEISLKYKCNVIVTSLDIEFDRGYYQDGSSKELSGFPKEYLDRFDYVLQTPTL